MSNFLFQLDLGESRKPRTSALCECSGMPSANEVLIVFSLICPLTVLRVLLRYILGDPGIVSRDGTKKSRDLRGFTGRPIIHNTPNNMRK